MSGEDGGYFTTHMTLVTPDMCDHLGHMNVQFHARCFGDAAFAIMARLGLGPEAIARRRIALVAGRMEVDYLAEARAGDVLQVRSTLSNLTERKVSFLHRMDNVAHGKPVARAHVTSVCVDLDRRRSSPIPDDIAERIRALAL